MTSHDHISDRELFYAMFCKAWLVQCGDGAGYVRHVVLEQSSGEERLPATISAGSRLRSGRGLRRLLRNLDPFLASFSHSLSLHIITRYDTRNPANHSLWEPLDIRESNTANA